MSTPNLSDKIEKLDTAISKLAASGSEVRKGVPGVRRGEDPYSSRGYSFCKLFQLMSGNINKENARLEVDTHNELQKSLYERQGYSKAEGNSILAPFATDFLPQESDSDRKFALDIRARVKAGVAGLDPEAVRGLARTINKTLSWQDEQALGALVSPPTFGELIDILRNNEVLLRAGASSIGMPANGRIVFPRQTGVSTAYHVGESVSITDSEPQTGDVTLQAKKLATLVKAPNELFRYASVGVEALLRMDMAKVMSLKMDNQLIEGVGSSVAPRGLINYSGITAHTAAGTPADAHSGYPLTAEDVYNMIAKVEEQNAVFKSWVMRPLMYSYIFNRRADAVSAGDGKGAYLFNVWRELALNAGVDRDGTGNLAGYPVFKTTNISKTRTRGSGTTNNTYILGGDFSDYMIAMSPVVEFALNQQATEAFTQDQTWLRAILHYDGAPRREASFLLCDNLLFS